MYGVVITFLLLGILIGMLFQHYVDQKEIQDADNRYLKMRGKFITATSYSTKIIQEDFNKNKGD